MHLLVLDLDETLLHSVHRSPSLSSAGSPPSAEALRAFGGARVFAHGAYVTGYRPGLAGFLRAVGARYRLAVWSAGGAAYVAGALEGLRALSGVEPEFEFVFSRERCTPRVGEEGTLVPEKNLEKVFRRGWRREHVLVLDDRPEGLRRHRANLIRAHAWTGAPDDRELERLLPDLERLANAPNVRDVRAKRSLGQ